MLRFLDVVLTVIHLVIIVFNLFGWIPRRTRKAHLISVLLTACSWFILGIWYGFGYCPVTDWQWRIKEKLGETNLPRNFVEYFAEKITGKDFQSQFISNIIGISFGFVTLISFYFFFLRMRGKQQGD